LTISLEADLALDAYADLAHAVWCSAKLALPEGGFSVKHDGINTSPELQARWETLARQVPWED